MQTEILEIIQEITRGNTITQRETFYQHITFVLILLWPPKRGKYDEQDMQHVYEL